MVKARTPSPEVFPGAHISKSSEFDICIIMPSSQLKRLKSSLREQGIVGPQKSKKQKKKASKDGSFKEGRVQRNTALQGIREQFNPFEIRAPTRTKYEFANNKVIGGNAAKSIISRPGFTKGLGEEKV